MVPPSNGKLSCSSIHFMTVKVIKNNTVTAVKVNRRCLFAVDVQMDCPTSGFFFSTQQQEGLKCPCCRRTQQQCYGWRGINFGGPSESVGTANHESITLELEPPQSQSQSQLHAYSGYSHPGKWWSCCKRKKA